MKNFWTRFKAAWHMQKSFDPVLLERVAELVAHADQVDGSGEYKRHQVYARLIKEYPATPRSTLALAIEVARCGL